MTRRAAPVVALVAALVAVLVPGWAGDAAARMVEDGGYKYLQISLAGLWGGFFVFLFGIAFILVGLLLFFAWRHSGRRPSGATPAEGQEEDDGRVF